MPIANDKRRSINNQRPDSFGLLKIWIQIVETISCAVAPKKATGMQLENGSLKDIDMLSRGWILIVVFVVWLPKAWGSDRFYQDLGNPTEYTFSASVAEIVEVLRDIQGAGSWGPMAGAYYEDEGTYGFGVYDFYTIRYWTGHRETDEEVDPPEAGRIGTIDCHFTAHFIPQGEMETLVRISVDSFEQQTGRRYRIFPHFQKVPVMKEVKSDTYFEYLFLSKLGELLGEENMPVIRGSPD